MSGFEEGNAVLARMIGHARSSENIAIKSRRGASAAREEVAAALSRAMMRGDIQGVVAALNRLGVQAPLQDMRHR